MLFLTPLKAMNVINNCEVVMENEIQEPENLAEARVPEELCVEEPHIDAEQEAVSEEADDREEENARRLRNRENIRRPKWFEDYETGYVVLSGANDPVTYDEAIKGKDAEKWKQAVLEELNDLQDNNTRTVIDQPPNADIIDTKHIHEPEVLDDDDSDDEKPMRRRGESNEEEKEEDELISDEEIERRRQMVRQKGLERKEDQEMEILDKEEESHSPEENAEEFSEYEEYSDSEEETGPRLKPVFVRKRDWVTVIEKEKEKEKQKLAENEAKKIGRNPHKTFGEPINPKIKGGHWT
jgi:hypothetical protein